MHIINEYNGLLIIIPTRNRSDLAINAILSVLNQPNCEEVKVLVSDNSTDLKDIEILYKFCQATSDERLSYIKPPEPLSMTKHWDWAVNQAFEKYTISHLLYLTDRMIFKFGQLKELINIVKRYPDYIVSYNLDLIIDDRKPIKLVQREWSGKLHKIKSTQLLLLSSQASFHGLEWSMINCLPKMLNCITPCTILHQISTKFGNTFGSISPDYNFCYRSLELVESIIYFDKSPILHYAISQSNGASFVRGIMSKASSDFLANLGQSDFCSATPIPSIHTVGNAIWHEYCTVKKETGSTKFPDIDMNCYLNYLGSETSKIINPELKAEMQATLSTYGWLPPVESKEIKSLKKEDLLLMGKKLLSPSIVWNKIMMIVKTKIFIKIKYAQPFILFLANNFGLIPPKYIDCYFDFNTLEDAFAYANKFPKSSYTTYDGKSFVEKILENDCLDISL
jgi:hypothetical protein